MMAERLHCVRCGVEWTYYGYPAYIGCPKCDGRDHRPVKHTQMCEVCKGTGKVETNSIDEPRYGSWIKTDEDAMKVAKETMTE